MNRTNTHARLLADVLTGSGLVMKNPVTGLGAPPRVIGRYALFAELASGGMGTVHLGRRLGPSAFEPVVAIKRAHPHLGSDPEFIELFRQEIRLLSQIRHRNVAPALDVTEEHGELLIMEYVHGQALSSLTRQARDFNQAIPTEICLAIACDMLDGLHAAHGARDAGNQLLGIVHRDVSPQNVIVGCDGCTRILDFGVAKARDSSNSTRAGQVKGKLGYLAPEHILGKKLDSRADVYAVSVVLWEMLAQARLFGAKRDSETVQDIFAGDIPRPSAVSARRLPAQVEDVLLRGLATDPQARFATAADMAQALRDAAPIASLLDVGEWVTQVAHSALVARSRQLAWAENCPLPVHPTLRPEGPAAHAVLLEPKLAPEPDVDLTRVMPSKPDDYADLTLVESRFSGSLLDPLPDPVLEAPKSHEITRPAQRRRRTIDVARRYALYFAAFVAVMSVINSASQGALSAKLRRALHPAVVRPESRLSPVSTAEVAAPPPVVELNALPVEAPR